VCALARKKEKSSHTHVYRTRTRARTPAQVCREQGVPLKLQAPLLADIDGWQGAFISSTSRLLLPACEVGYSDAAGQPRTKVRVSFADLGRAWLCLHLLHVSAVLSHMTHARVWWCCCTQQVFAQQHPLVSRLEAEVMAKVVSCSEPLDAHAGSSGGSSN
jgi:hypothetical protein